MATTPVEFYAPTGLTLTAHLFPYASDLVANGAGDSCTERTNCKGLYTFDVTEELSGFYDVCIKDGSGTVIATYSLYLQDDSIIYRCGDVALIPSVSIVSSIASGVWSEVLTTYVDDSTAGKTLINLAGDVWNVGLAGHLATRTTGGALSVASSRGTGARTVTVTVDDGSTALEGASVRLVNGGYSYVQTTNISGQCTFNVDDGTWTVAITLAGYTYSGTTLVVADDATATYSMTAYAITAPAAANLTTGYALCLGTNGLAEAGVTITAHMVEGPGDAGYALDTGMTRFTSDANGLAEHTGFVRGAKYRFCRGTSSWGASFTAPDSVSWAIGEILGSP